MNWSETHNIRNQKVKELLEESKRLINSDAQSVYLQYAIVQISAILENGVIDIINEFCRNKKSDENITGFIRKKLQNHFNSPSFSQIISLLGEFNDQWSKKIKNTIPREHKEKIKGLIILRNQIAHGKDPNTDIYIDTVNGYYDAVTQLIGAVACTVLDNNQYAQNVQM